MAVAPGSSLADRSQEQAISELLLGSKSRNPLLAMGYKNLGPPEGFSLPSTWG